MFSQSFEKNFKENILYFQFADKLEVEKCAPSWLLSALPKEYQAPPSVVGPVWETEIESRCKIQTNTFIKIPGNYFQFKHQTEIVVETIRKKKPNRKEN